jgi:hypothetical protein
MHEKSLRRILGVLNRLGVLEVFDAAEASTPDGSPGEALLRTSDFSFADLIPVVTNAILNE